MVFGFLVLFLVLQFNSQIKNFIDYNKERIQTYGFNFFYMSGAGPKRYRPVSLLERETELKLYIGEPFKSFNQADWDDFWNLIYGAFPKDPPKKEGLPRRMRQLTLDEIRYELMLRYPTPFNYFKKEHWGMFFGIVLKR